MVKMSYNLRRITLNGTLYTMFIGEHGGDHFYTYDPDNIFIQTGKVYVRIGETGGEINTILMQPEIPWAEGNILDQFGHMIYHNSDWWLQIG